MTKITTGQNRSEIPQSELSVSFDAVREHLDETYVLTKSDWEKVDTILSWFSNDGWFASQKDKEITREEFLNIYDEDGNSCSDIEASSDFLGNDMVYGSAVFVSETDCHDPENHDEHHHNYLYRNQASTKLMEENKHDFSLWKSIGEYVQDQLGISEEEQLTFRSSCSSYDKDFENELLLRKEFEEKLKNFYDHVSASDRAGALSEKQIQLLSEMLITLIRDNDLDPSHVTDFLSFLENNPEFMMEQHLAMSMYFKEKTSPSRDFDLSAIQTSLHSFENGTDSTIAAMYAKLFFEISWDWNYGYKDLLLNSTNKAKDFGGWTDTTNVGDFTFHPDGRISIFLRPVRLGALKASEE